MKRLYTFAAAIAGMGAPMVAIAQVAGVAPLLEQGRYWDGKGRPDLANQAYRRVLAIDPSNAAARRGIDRPAPVAAAASRPASAAPPKARTPVAPAPAAPRPTTRPAPVDTQGQDRVAGFQALDRDDLGEADRRFSGVVRRSPNDGDALGGLGIVRLRQERFADAQDLLQRASRRGNAGRWAEALGAARFYATLRKAQADFDAGRLPQAQSAAESLAKSGFAERGPALQLLASVYERQGRYADAAALYTTASQGTGRNAQANTDLQSQAARAQAQQAIAAGRTADAQQMFDRAMMLRPDDAWIRYDYARFLTQQGRPMDASAVIAPLGQSQRPEALYAAALYYSQAGQTANAEALVNRIPAGQRTAEMSGLIIGLKSDAAITRARTMAAQGRTSDALAGLRQIAATPGLPASKLASIAGVLAELGEQSGAATLAQQALTAGPDSAAAYEPIVRVLAGAGQDSFALSAIQRASELAGNSPDGQRTTGRLNGALAAARADRLRLAGQYAPAFDTLQQAWATAPNNPELLAALARLYQAGGMHLQASQTYRLLLQTSPTDRAALVGLIDSASAAGDFDVARQATDQAIRGNPNDYETYLAAARMESARGDKGASGKYLRRARALYLAQSGVNQGGMLSANPFSLNASGNPFTAPAPVSVNPFALAANPNAYAQQMASNGYGAVAPTGFAPARSDGLSPFGAAPAPQYQTFGGGQVQPGYGGQPTSAGPITDPVLAGIERDMRTLADSSATRVDVTTNYRSRSGETGLSDLKELGGTATVSSGLGRGRVSVSGNAVVLDAGRPTGSGLARFGRNATAEAQGIVAALPSQLTQAETQHASGVAINAAYEDKLVKADVGTTPLGFRKSQLQGGLAVTPRLSEHVTARLWGERRPVTDSVVAYAGTRDPVGGDYWGAVMRSGGGLSLSYDKEGTGVYADGSYSQYAGTNVRDNKGLQFNAGGYLRALKSTASELTLGINANYQAYDNNQNYFTYGQGGYFSPQSFLSVSFPMRYTYKKGLLDVTANAAPGYQSYEQQAEPLYPTDPAAQAVLDAAKAANSDVRSRFDSISQTGFGVSAGASAYYGVTGNMRIGGDVQVNTFGEYKEMRTSIGIKQQLGGGK